MDFHLSGTFSRTGINAIGSLGDIRVRGAQEMWLQFLVGVANFTAFAIDFRSHPLGDWFQIAGVSTDYTTPEGPVMGASEDLTTAAFGATPHWVKLNVRGVHDVRFRAAGTNSSITASYGAR
jgi:hypothetical protein